jgi:hypothetical protein
VSTAALLYAFHMNRDLGRSRVEASQNTPTVALRVVRGDGKGTPCPGAYLGHPVPAGYKYRDLALQDGESEEFGQ